MLLRRALAWGGFAPVFLACSLVTRFDGLVPITGDASVVNPSPDAGSDGGLAPSDGSTATLTFATACAQLFSSFVNPCTLPNVPASDLPRLQARWVTTCTSAFALSGSIATPSELSQCAAAYVGYNCLDTQQPTACVAAFSGLRESGAPCAVSSQCQSASCDLYVPDATTSPGCGTCDLLLEDGQPCGTTGTACPSNEVCLFPADTCGHEDGGAFIRTIPMGAACSFDASAPECDLGLFCGADGTCEPATLAGAGQPCDGVGRLCIVGYCSGASVNPEPDGSSETVPGTCPTVIADGQPCDPSSLATTCDVFASCFSGTCVLDYSNSLCP